MSAGDAELLVVAAADRAGLASRAAELALRAAEASGGELGELAAALVGEVAEAADRSGPVRGVVIAATPEEAAEGLEALARAAAGEGALLDAARGRFLAEAPAAAVDAHGGARREALTALGAAWALGAPVDVRELLAARPDLARAAAAGVPAAAAGVPAAVGEPAAGGGEGGGARAARPELAAGGRPPAAADWIRAFAVIEEDAPPPRPPRARGGAWQWYGGGGRDRAAIARALYETGGGTVVVLDGAQARDFPALVAAAHAAAGPVLIVDRPRIAGGFARTWHLETGLPVAVVSYDRLDAGTAAALRAEAAGLGAGFRAVHVAEGGRLRTPVLDAIEALDVIDASGTSDWPLAGEVAAALGPSDVLLVTTDGDGLATACALALAERTGCAVVTLGVAAPDLARFAARGVCAVHRAANLADPSAVRRALSDVPAALGSITALVHAPGVAARRTLRELTALDLAYAIAPQVTGYAAVLAAIDPARLTSIVAFGSLVARTGLPGEAAAALAGELLCRAVERTRRELLACRCTVLEWPSGPAAGGAPPISIDRGVDAFLRMFGAGGSLAITGRRGDTGLAAYRRRELPRARFLERPLVHVPGVELVTEAELSPDVDLYADDHVLDGARVMPAAMQLEAACQLAAALAPGTAFHVAEVRFPRAITIGDGGTTLRIAACLHDGGAADVAITASDDGHASERMRARLERAPDAPPPEYLGVPPRGALPPPYGALLPQRGRFRRIRAYRVVSTRWCCFEVETGGPAAPWFAPHVVPSLCLADPGVRDAVLHGIQLAVPHERLVPVAASGVEPAARWPEGSVVVYAGELAADCGEYVWTIEIADPRGALIERWAEVRFRTLGPRREIPPSAIGPWIERRIGELSPVVRRVILDGRATSAAEVGALRLAAIADEPVACDLQIVAPRPERVWRDLLGAAAPLAPRIAAMLGEPLDRAATRVACALACCAKLGAPDAPLLIRSAAGDAVCLGAGNAEIATVAIAVGGVGGLVAAVATAPDTESLILEAAS